MRGWVGVLLVAAGCSSGPSPGQEAGVEGRAEVVLEGGTTWIGADLQVATGNFDLQDYTTEDGDLERGWTASLWLSVPDEVSGGWRQTHQRVFPGKRLVVSRY